LVLTSEGGSCVYVQIDGEFAGHLPAEVRMVPDALTLLMPPEYCRAANAPVPAQPGQSLAPSLDSTASRSDVAQALSGNLGVGC
jgi:hypothetical protein